jgi:hypothetical protein
MSEVNSILLDIQEVYKEVGTDFSFVRLNTSTPSNVYKESKGKTYSTPIPLNGMITFSPEQKNLSEIGVERKVSVVFKVAYQSLIDTGISLLSNREVLSSFIQYNNDLYEIVNYIPRSLYQGAFLIYNFECIREE